MSNHPLNLALRFILELLALAIFFLWGWQHQGFLKYLLAFGTPILAMVIWGTFRVPNDPGKAPVAVSGRTRLLIELVFYGAAEACLFSLQQLSFAYALSIVLIIHYAVSYDRVGRLLLNQPIPIQ